MRILFVENHAVFAQVATAQFLAGHAVTVAASVASALALLDDPARAFDAVLVDYDLDDGKGTALLEAMRDRGVHVPVIAVSSHEEGNAALLRAGAVAACSKARFATIGAVLARVASPVVV